MKYLKEYNSHTLYEEIPMNEYGKLMETGSVNIEEKLVELVKSLKYQITRTNKTMFVFQRFYTYIEIRKKVDEWYLVEIYFPSGPNRFWKCDQIEGVEKFINDLKSILENN